MHGQSDLMASKGSKVPMRGVVGAAGRTTNSTMGRLAPANPKEKPDEDMVLRGAIGYECDDFCGNVHYTAQWRVAYTTSSLGVICHSSLSTEKNRRKLFLGGHKSTITASCMNASRTLLATSEGLSVGQETPEIRVWNVQNGECVCKIPVASAEESTKMDASLPRIVTRVLVLGFSPDDTKLSFVCDDSRHTVTVLESADRWATHRLRARKAGSKLPPLFLCWKSNSVFLTGGEGFSCFWSPEGECRKGLFQSCPADTLTCCAAVANFAVAGTQKGFLYVFEENQAIAALPLVGGGAVTCITAVANEQVALGTRGGVVALLRFDERTQGKFVLVQRFDLGGAVLAALEARNDRLFSTAVMAVDCRTIVSESVSKEGGGSGEPGKTERLSLLVATAGADLLEFQCAGDGAHRVTQATVLLHGHGGVGGQRGLVCHPTNDAEFASSGEDRTVRIWNALSGRQVAWSRLPGSSSCLDYAPNGSALAVGLDACDDAEEQPESETEAESKLGGLVVLRVAGGLKQTLLSRPGVLRGAVTVIRYSPDGALLALGSELGEVQLLSVAKEYATKESLFVGGAGERAVTKMDFSVKGDFLRLQLADDELVFIQTRDGKTLVEGEDAVSKASWASQNCTKGAAVQGLWQMETVEGVSSCCRDRQQHLLATTDDAGVLRLFRFPVRSKEHKCRTLEGLARKDSTLAISANGSWLISSSGLERTILVFGLVPSLK